MAIIVLSVPAWMVPVAVIAWACAAVALGLALASALVPVRMRPAARSVLVGFGVSCAAIALVATAASVDAPERRPAALAQSKTIADATVMTTQTAVPTSKFFAATVVDADGISMSVPVLVFGAAPDQRIEIGTALSLSGSLVATPPNDEVSYLVFARGPGEVVAQPAWYLTWANELRSGFASAATSLPGDGGTLLPGLAIGDTVAVSPQLSANMKTSSLSHLTAVSGANCAVVIGLILLVGRAFGFSRSLRVAVALAVLVGFVVLVTPQPSVLRSAIMAALLLGALASGRPIAGLPVVGVTALVMLVLDPWLAVNYGFALSVLATAGLMVLTGPIAQRLEAFLPRWLALLIAVPLAAQLACQPVLILLQPSLPLYGVLANSLAEPASPVATVLGLVACVALPLLPPVGHALAAIAWLPSSWIAAVANFFAGLPGARLPWPGGFLGGSLLALVTILLTAAALSRLSTRVRGAMAGAAGILLAASFLIAALIPGVGVPPAAARSLAPVSVIHEVLLTVTMGHPERAITMTFGHPGQAN